MIEHIFPHCRVLIDSEAKLVRTIFEDGTEAHATPHYTRHYRKCAMEAGCGLDVFLYCAQHDLAHVLIGEMNYGGVSPTLWAIAHGQDTSTGFEKEEAEAVELQKLWMNPRG